MFYKIIVFSSTYTLTLLIKWIQTPRQASTQVNDSMKFTSRLQINLYNKHSSQLFTWTLVTANTQKKVKMLWWPSWQHNHTKCFTELSINVPLSIFGPQHTELICNIITNLTASFTYCCYITLGEQVNCIVSNLVAKKIISMIKLQKSSYNRSSQKPFFISNLSKAKCFGD